MKNKSYPKKEKPQKIYDEHDGHNSKAKAKIEKNKYRHMKHWIDEDDDGDDIIINYRDEEE